jgi:glycosyltransferase involved in cell wall biosynthesis
LWYALALKAELQRLQPSLLATYNWGAIDAVLAARLGRICPVVHAEDGFGPDEAVSLKRRRVLARRFVLRNVFATVVPSRTLWSAAIHQYQLPESRVRLIRNGVDLARFRPNLNRSWRRARNIPDNDVLIGFVGALRPEKRLDHLLLAFSSVARRPARLAIVGDGPCRNQLGDLSRSLELADRVVFAGHMTDPAPAYASFDLFALSSVTEQMPISLLEAMATGTAAVCTDVGDVAEVIGDSPFPCVVPVDDLGAFKQALSTLVSDAWLRRRLGDHNRRRAEANFCERRMLAEYRQLYGSAIDRPPVERAESALSVSSHS